MCKEILNEILVCFQSTALMVVEQMQLHCFESENSEPCNSTVYIFFKYTLIHIIFVMSESWLDHRMLSQTYTFIARLYFCNQWAMTRRKSWWGSFSVNWVRLGAWQKTWSLDWNTTNATTVRLLLEVGLVGRRAWWAGSLPILVSPRSPRGSCHPWFTLCVCPAMGYSWGRGECCNPDFQKNWLHSRLQNMEDKIFVHLTVVWKVEIGHIF